MTKHELTPEHERVVREAVNRIRAGIARIPASSTGDGDVDRDGANQSSPGDRGVDCHASAE